MTALAQPITPPAPKVHARDLPSWRILIEAGRNSLGIWPERAFEQLFSRSRMLGIESALVNDPDDVRHVLTTRAANYTRPVSVYRVIRPLTGTGLLLAGGEAWRRQRLMLAPVFTPSSIGLLLPHFVAAAETMVGKLREGSRANLSKAFYGAALDAVLRALFSLPATEETGGFATLVRRYVSGPGRPTPFDGLARSETDFAFFNRRRRRFSRDRTAAVSRTVHARREEPAGRDHADLLDLLLAARDPESGEALSKAEIGDQTATLLFAGFETTSRLLFWAAYLLALDPAQQSRLREEVLAFAPERIAGLDDLHHWPRLRATLLETLRLYPPVPNIVREAIESDVIHGEEIRPGTQVWISPWVIHRHRKFWDHPTEFRPERFEGKPAPWTSGPFLPFGGGPRICIGASFAMAEAQIVLATLLSRFAFTLESRRPVSPVAGLTTAPSYEPWFRLTRIRRPEASGW